MKKIIILIVFAGMLFSCSVRGNLKLDNRGAGSMEMDFSLAPFFGDFFIDLVDDETLMAETSRGFDENKGITNHTIIKNGYTYRGSIDFDKFEDVVNGDDEAEEQTVFTMTEQSDATTLDIHFSRENWNQMSVLVPIFSDPTIAMLGPDGSLGLTEDEYREMVIYPFEGYADSLATAEKSLDESTLEFIVTVPNQIVSQKGGTVSGKSVTFQVPLIRMLMLDEELSYSVTYR